MDDPAIPAIMSNERAAPMQPASSAAEDANQTTSSVQGGSPDATSSSKSASLNEDIQDDDDFGDFAAATVSSEGKESHDDDDDDNAGLQSTTVTSDMLTEAVAVNEPNDHLRMSTDDTDRFNHDHVMRNRETTTADAESAVVDSDFLQDFSGNFESTAVKQTDALDNTDASPLTETNLVEEANAVVSDRDQQNSLSEDDDDDHDDDDVGYFSTHADAENHGDNGTKSSDDNDDSQGSSPGGDAGYFSAMDNLASDDNEASQVEDEGSEAKATSLETTREYSEETKIGQKDGVTENSSSRGGEGEPPVLDTDSVVQLEIGEDDAVSKQMALSSPGRVEEPKAGDDVTEKQYAGAAEVKGDEGFGDFGDFAAAEVDGAAESAGGNGKDVSEDNEPDVSAVKAGGEAKMEETPADDEFSDDDFGDFGTFEQAEESPPVDANAGGVNGEATDDDFGDFERPHQEARLGAMDHIEPKVGAAADDDFGEFGDFTDFGSGETPQVGSERSGALETVGEAPASRSTPPSSSVDPITEKAEAIFVEVFGHGTTALSEPEQNASKSVNVSVHSVLSELAVVTSSQDPSAWFTDSFASIMRGVEHGNRGGPVSIVDDCSEYPYAHFAVPICGLPVSKDIQPGSQPLAQSRKVAETPSLPEIECTSSSLNTANSDSAEPARPTQESSGTVVALPPLKSNSDAAAEKGSSSDFSDFESAHDSVSAQASQRVDIAPNGGKEALSSSAKQFLQQIPDLSFMLKPTLSLPKKS